MSPYNVTKPQWMNFFGDKVLAQEGSILIEKGPVLRNILVPMVISGKLLCVELVALVQKCGQHVENNYLKKHSMPL